MAEMVAMVVMVVEMAETLPLSLTPLVSKLMKVVKISLQVPVTLTTINAACL